MIKKILLAISTLAVAVCVWGCYTKVSQTATFELATGDNVEVKLDTAGGYDLALDESAARFSVTKDGETVLRGYFCDADAWHEYYEAAETAELIEKTDNKVVWGYEDADSTEYNTATLLSDKSAVVTNGVVSDTNAKDQILDAASKLEFTLEK